MAIKLLDHLKDVVTHITSAERTSWNSKAAGVHNHSGYLQGLVFTNIFVLTTAFVTDATYTNWPYRATVALIGVTADMTPEVVFDPDTAVGGVLAAIVSCYAGGIYLYANAVPAIDLTIPTITCRKAVP